MKLDRRLTADNAKIYTTEELLQNQVKILVHALMDEGKDGPTHGWVMSEILAEISEKFGEKMADFARRYIVIDVCGMEEHQKLSKSKSKRRKRPTYFKFR